MHTVVDAAALRRIEKRKVRHVTELERGHLQDHRGQVGTQDFRVGEARPTGEVQLGVQPDAHTRGGAAGPPRSLRCRSLGDGFNRQSLHFGAPAVARYSGGPRVDDIVNSRNSQGCLSDIGGQYDAPRQSAGVDREHLLLLGGGQPRIERQHLRTRHRSAHRLGGIPDLTLTG